MQRRLPAERGRDTPDTKDVTKVPNTWTVHSILKVTSDYLTGKGIDSPRLSAELLLAHQLNLDRVNLYLNYDRPLNEKELDGYRSLVRRRLNREPIQYITGVQEFWSLDFAVNPDVLIPRPESEVLIEQVLSLFEGGRVPEGRSPRILDLGTGSGALAVTLAREIENAVIWASDISKAALEVARRNAGRHGVAERITFVEGDLFQPFRARHPSFDVILSNPPYIISSELDALAPEVRDHEPRLALDGGVGGMDYITKILAEGPEYLNSKGWILMEMDPEQTLQALSVIETDPRYGEGDRIQDYSHRYRVVVGRKV